MEPKIVQDYFLLAIKPETGYYYNAGNELLYGLNGAMVMDLYLGGAIDFKLKYISLTDPTLVTGVEYFDRILLFIGKRQFPIKTYGLISRLGFRAQSYKKQIVSDFIEKKLIIVVKRKFLFIPYKRYFPAQREVRFQIVRRIRDILLRGESYTKEDSCLLVLIHATGLMRALSDMRDERKIMRKRLKQIIKSNSNNTKLDENLLNLGQCIRQAIMASNAARHGAA